MYLSLLWRPRFKEKGFCKITELFKLQEADRINGSVQEYFLLVILFFPFVVISESLILLIGVIASGPRG